MSVLTALSTMVCDPGMGGGSVVTFVQLSELLGHLDSGSCTAEQVEAMAAEHRGPTPAEWNAMRGEVSEQVETTPEPTPAPEPDAEETPEAEAGGESAPDAESEPGADEDVAPV